MYKIYINGTPLYLGTKEELNVPGEENGERLQLFYAGKRKFLMNIIDQMEKSSRFSHVALFSADVEQLWADFKSIFKCIGAAGGVVNNDQGETLFIFRRGFWDLPKGKIDKGEAPGETALREVSEETGLERLALGAPLGNTFHTYRLNGKRILKTTFWYRMAAEHTELTPQREEDIEEARWMNLHDFLAHPPGPVYGSIMDILHQSMEKQSKS
ncbi:MAG: NUDIX hydrolase [Saprospiraceae bacterium]